MNPCPLQAHAATKWPQLHDVGPAPPLAVLEPVLLNPHTHMQDMNKQKTSGHQALFDPIQFYHVNTYQLHPSKYIKCNNESSINQKKIYLFLMNFFITRIARSLLRLRLKNPISVPEWRHHHNHFVYSCTSKEYKDKLERKDNMSSS